MNTKVLVWAITAGIGGTHCATALASEHEQAMAACRRVSPLWVAEQQHNGQTVAPLPCQFFTEPPAYWQCMEEQLVGGNPWRYAEAKCDGKRHRRPGWQVGAPM